MEGQEGTIGGEISSRSCYHCVTAKQTDPWYIVLVLPAVAPDFTRPRSHR
jgi:hypothetical protein